VFLTDTQRATISRAISEGLSYTEAARLAACKVATAKTYGRRGGVTSPKTARWLRNRQLLKEGRWFCPGCKQELPLSSFRLDRQGRVRYGNCQECCRKNDVQRSSLPRLRFQVMVNQARVRARKKNIPFGITVTDVANLWDVQGGACHYTGEALTCQRNRQNTISLDRIVPSKGYIPGNIVLCCDVVNKMKWDMDDDSLVVWCKKILRHMEG
jgi:hypothetical protein